MESERGSTQPIRRKPMNTADAVTQPTGIDSRSVEPASEPLLSDQENDPNTPTKTFDQKQSPNLVSVVPANDQTLSPTLNQEDFATGGYKTEKASPCAEAISSKGLAQAKWIWFKHPRPLKDFEAFDRASRGLGGSLSLLSHTKGWFVGIIAAFLLSTTIATSTITQFAVTYPSRLNQDGSKGSAEAWRLGESWGKDESNYAFMNEPAIARGVRRGIHNLVTETIPFREPKCASANCRWPEFRTLAIGYKATNVTHLIEADVNFHDGNPNITLPNGVHTEPGKSRARYTGAPTFFLGSGPTLVHQHLRNASILDYFAIYWEPSNILPWAVEVSFYWCIDTYHPELVDNVLRMNKSASQIPKLHALQGDDYRGYVSLESPDKDDVTWTIGGLSTRTIATQLNESLSGYTVVLAGEPMRGTSGSDILAQATKEVAQKLAKGNSTLEIYEAEKAWSTALEGLSANVANSLTNTLLPDQSNINGLSLNTEVYVLVRWEWLALLSVQVALSICLLICIIVESTKAEVEVMKGSTVPVLFAINAADKARMENGDFDSDSLRQIEHQQKLAHVNLRSTALDEDAWPEAMVQLRWNGLRRTESFSTKTRMQLNCRDFIGDNRPVPLPINSSSVSMTLLDDDIGELPALSTLGFEAQLESTVFADTQCIASLMTPAIPPAISSGLRYGSLGIFLFVFFVSVLRTIATVPGLQHRNENDSTRSNVASNATVLPSVSNCLHFLQFIFLTGGLSLSYPGFYPAAVAHLNWFALFADLALPIRSFVPPPITGVVIMASTYPGVRDGLYEVNGTYGGYPGLEVMTQMVGAPMTCDTWLLMLCFIASIAMMLGLFLWLLETLRPRNVLGLPLLGPSDRTLGMRIGNGVLKLVLSYITLPLVALSIYQLNFSGTLGAGHVTLTVVVLVLILLAFAWVAVRLPSENLGALVFEAKLQYQHVGGDGGQDFEEEKQARREHGYVIVLFVLNIDAPVFNLRQLQRRETPMPWQTDDSPSRPSIDRNSILIRDRLPFGDERGLCHDISPHGFNQSTSSLNPHFYRPPRSPIPTAPGEMSRFFDDRSQDSGLVSPSITLSVANWPSSTNTKYSRTSLPNMSPIIHCVRHGQGVHNLSYANHDLPDPELTPLGEEQARALTTRFPDLANVELIVSSPLRRTIQTALLAFPSKLEDGMQVLALPEVQEASELICDTGSPLPDIKANFDGLPVDFSLVEPDWCIKQGKWAPIAACLLERAALARRWLSERAEAEVVVISHGCFLHFLTDDWVNAVNSQATDWANAEVRSFTLASDIHGGHSLDESEGSRKRRGCGQVALTKEQQLDLRDTVLKTWIEWGVIKE
ncbi:uncharacterized protein FIESC28_04679 [Fusarium coffeatum]|uniref:Uncharacterized protein n=1 Tax=Fusarium coffeatum TaxID=231269 RepID=A0A366RZQ9_9HYPO|nr:uncharacterized protein FIESC28_04679 [Fusarium coffeatum]RBR21966.1 hypothetical protein FIESC28_04679 [Fusarium coffeatum]